jgi:hypothetical protein
MGNGGGLTSGPKAKGGVLQMVLGEGGGSDEWSQGEGGVYAPPPLTSPANELRLSTINQVY